MKNDTSFLFRVFDDGVVLRDQENMNLANMLNEKEKDIDAYCNHNYIKGYNS